MKIFQYKHPKFKWATWALVGTFLWLLWNIVVSSKCPLHVWWWDARRGSGQDLVTLAPRNWFVSRPQQDGTARVLCPRTEGDVIGGKWQNWEELGILGWSWLVLVGIFFQSLNGKCVACVLSNMSVCSDSQFCSSTKQASRQNGHAQLLSTHTTHFYRDVFQFSSVFETGKNIFTKTCCYCASLVQVLRLKVPGPVWGWVVSTEHRDQRLPVRSWGRRRTHLQVNSAN